MKQIHVIAKLCHHHFSSCIIVLILCSTKWLTILFTLVVCDNVCLNIITLSVSVVYFRAYVVTMVTLVITGGGGAVDESC